MKTFDVEDDREEVIGQVRLAQQDAIAPRPDPQTSYLLANLLRI
ncbi:MAG: hypothetical protein AB4352_00215 [Hormoscilla sp.]